MPPRIVTLPAMTPPRKRRGTATALTVADMLTMTPGEVAAFVHDEVTAITIPDDDAPRVPSLDNRMHVAYNLKDPNRVEHARHLSDRARRIIGIGRFAGYYYGGG